MNNKIRLNMILSSGKNIIIESDDKHNIDNNLDIIYIPFILYNINR